MKKIILSLALITGSLTAFGQSTGEIHTIDGRDMVMPGDNVKIELGIIAQDNGGNAAVSLNTGEILLLATETPFDEGEVVSLVLHNKGVGIYDFIFEAEVGGPK